MTWFLVSDDMWAVVEAKGLSARAQALWLRAGSYCSQQLTDGHLTRRELSLVRGTLAAAKELVDAGLWDEDGPGFVFKSWGSSQATREQVEAKREKWKRAKSKTSVDIPPRNPTLPVPVPVPVPEEKKNTCVSSQYERPPLPEPPPELEPVETPLTAELLNEHARGYSERRSGEVPMRNYRAALALAQWCTQNASAHRCTPLELGKRVLQGMFANAKAATKRWPLSFAAQDPAEYVSSPMRPVAYVEPAPLVSPEKVAELQRKWEERQLAKRKSSQVAS